MPTFRPFAALRYSDPNLDDLIAPPYDVLSDRDIDELAALSDHNIVHIDVPREADGPDRYRDAGERMRSWVDDAVLVGDPEPSLTIYRMSFTDPAGAQRTIVGVLGGVEVVDEGAGGVLPHERVTKKASTDRLDLTRATNANLSPIWGLSLATGLSDLLEQPGEPMGSVTVDGVTHSVERVLDPTRIAAICAAVEAEDVLIADGHHRYGVAQQFRDEVRETSGRTDTRAEETLCFVSELVEEQLSVEAIHRVYRAIDRKDLESALAVYFDLEPAGELDDDTLSELDDRGALRLACGDGTGAWLTPRPGAFDDIRSIDGLWLETALANTPAEVTYQHGLNEVGQILSEDPSVSAAILIRPVSVHEIERTAREGLLMPPKVTFFTPKLRTGFVVREM